MYRLHGMDRKKQFSVLSTLLMTVMVFLMLSSFVAGAASVNRITDHLGVLESNEIQQLQASSDELREAYEMDVVVLLVSETEGMSSMEYADQYYEEQGYGVGPEEDGLIMLVNMEAREIWITTAGKAIGIFTDQSIDSMTASIASFLADGDFYGAGQEYMRQVDHYASVALAPPPGFGSKLVSMMTFWPLYLVAAIVSGISTLAVGASHKSKPEVAAQTYAAEGSFRVTNSKEDFLRETTNRVYVPKPKPSSASSSAGGGRSTTRTTSSGRTRGGGGRKF